jgi:mono/diheme cytochrome c family protein
MNRLLHRPFLGRDSPGRAKPRNLALAVTMAFALAACGDSTEGGEGDTPIAPQDGALALRGAEVFQASCARCHGADVRGTDNGPSLLSEVYEPDHHADLSFLLAVQRGTPAHHWRMPPIEGLTQDDVAAVTAFVRENQRTQGFEPYPP